MFSSYRLKTGFLILLFVVAGLLRFVNLGYSDYQGDEIKALYNPKENNTTAFFLEQRKGPMQFIVTAGLRAVSHNYSNRFLVRLPFALAGFGSVILFYLLIEGLFNKRVAFYATIFFATNGFLVAFSRIVQYQSLVIFFGILSVYLIYKYTIFRHRMYLVWSFVCWAVSVLSHYDGVFFAPIIAALLISSFLKLSRGSQRKKLLLDCLIATGVFVVLAGTFYVPFVLNIAGSTLDYWSGRITGDVSGKISSSRYLFSVYQPIYVLHVYTILGVTGFLLLVINVLLKLLPKKPCDVPAHRRFDLVTLLGLLGWFLLPFIAMEGVIYIPGTHIYAYLIPVFVFIGVLLFHLSTVVRKFSIPLFILFDTGVGVLTLFLFLQAYAVFVDHKTEYPWSNKSFLVWTLPKPTPIFHLSMFGFPYYRHWDEIGEYVRNDGRSNFYTTNERVSISRYHIRLEKDGGRIGYYVHIQNPQTFTNDITSEIAALWAVSHEPAMTFTNMGEVVSKIYLIP